MATAETADQAMTNALVELTAHLIDDGTRTPEELRDSAAGIIWTASKGNGSIVEQIGKFEEDGEQI